MNYLPFNFFKCFSLLRAPLKIVLLPGHSVERAYNLTSVWDMPNSLHHFLETGIKSVSAGITLCIMDQVLAI